MNENHRLILERLSRDQSVSEAIARATREHAGVMEVYLDLFVRQPALEPVAISLFSAYQAVIRCFDEGGTLFVCGNGGSFSDALHITGELLKSFERNRLLSPDEREVFLGFPYGEEISSQLEHGFRAIALGSNPVLSSAVQNDFVLEKMQYAQELFALGRKGDVLIAISTSGNAGNVLYAVTTARAIGVTTIGLTGDPGGELAGMVDISIRAPAKTTRSVQELHLPIYHALCSMIETHYYQAARIPVEPPRGSILDLDQLAAVVEKLKNRGKKIVWTNGCFDILHMGHVSYLRSAKELGDILVVGINSDRSVRAIKGPGRPVIPERQRAEVLSSLGCVDYVTIFNDTDTTRILQRIRPHIYAKGGDYNMESINQDERRVVERYGGQIRILPAVHDTSTTRIISRIANESTRRP